MSKSQLLVAALENGTVIDHIPADKVFTVVNLLGLQYMSTPITIGANLRSNKIGKKGIIKISDKFFSDDEINRLSLVAPHIQLNTIHNFEVVEKREVTLPDQIHGIVRCCNPQCVTNHEPMSTFFYVTDKHRVILRCHYCNKEMSKDDIKLM
ncbi:MAG TPA: aspartate carbamoyltransferase regulatory subunit [Bacteroidaceae bacterium]|nr:aspartate carbamoyltransferase regulatory subunit [Bacteroidaceae bacterium]